MNVSYQKHLAILIYMRCMLFLESLLRDPWTALARLHFDKHIKPFLVPKLTAFYYLVTRMVYMVDCYRKHALDARVRTMGDREHSEDAA
jgi:hypothetical protein